MKASELRETGLEDLRARARDLEDQLFRLRVQKAMGQAEAAHKLRPTRRDLARVLTVLREKTQGAGRSARREPAGGQGTATER